MTTNPIQLMYCFKTTQWTLVNNDFCDACYYLDRCARKQPLMPREAPLYCGVDYGKAIEVGKFGVDNKGVYVDLNEKTKLEEEEVKDVVSEAGKEVQNISQ